MKPFTFDPKEIEYRQDPQRELRGDLLFLTVLALFIVVINFFVPKYLLALIEVDGASMRPSFNQPQSDGEQDGGGSLLYRLFFGRRSSNSNNDMVLVLKTAEYTYGDVVIVYSKQLNKQLIKRVIGLPGDTVGIQFDAAAQKHCVYLLRDGEQTVLRDEPYILDDMNEDNRIYGVVGEGEVFVMGDNRNDSQDSRYLGPLKHDDVVGRVILRIDRSGMHTNFMTDYSYGKSAMLPRGGEFFAAAQWAASKQTLAV